jgi:transposase
MKEAIANARHTMFYLPPYSPDLNPIEKSGRRQNTRRTNGCSVETLFQKHLH